jgi:Protein of unknown function (DUF1573)
MKFFFIVFCSISILGCLENKKNEENKLLLVSKDTITFTNLAYSDTFKTLVFCINKSKEDIRILKIENACGCTSGVLKDSIVKIDDSIKLFISYIPRLVSDSGSVTKYLTLRTNAIKPFTNIVLKGNVKK